MQTVYVLAHRVDKYNLVYDSFFTELPLLEKLTEMDLCGTDKIRLNRTTK